MTAPTASLRLRFAAWLTLVAVLAAVFVVHVRPHLRIESDITAMLPRTAPDAVVAQALDRFGVAAGRRNVFLIEAPDFAAARAAGAAFARALAHGDAFESVEFERHTDLVAADALFGPYRYGLLSARDRALLQQGRSAELEQDALRGLYTPGGLLRLRPFADDPFNFYGDFLAGLGRLDGRLTLRDGVLAVEGPGQPAVLVAATLRDSPFAVDAQRAAAAALDAAAQAMHAAAPDAQMTPSGVLGHAIANTERATREIGLFGSLSLLGVVAVFLYCYRSLRPLLLVTIVLGLSALAPIVVVHTLFGQIHLLALVFGSSLIGVAVDYAIHFFSDQFRDPPHWSGAAALAHVRPAILIGMTTTALGYLAFLLPPFPGLRQMAVFSVAGLLMAGCTVLLAFPLVAGHGGRPMPVRLGRAMHALARLRRPADRVLHPLLALAIVATGVGLWRLEFVDDVRALQSSTPERLAQETHVRERLGGGMDTRFFLVEGADTETLLRREEALRDRLDALVGRDVLGGYLALSRVVPSAQRQAQNRALLAERVYADGAALPRLLAQLGFADAVVARQRAAFAEAAGRTLTLEAWLASPVSAALRSLWLGDTGRGVASAVALNGIGDVDALRAATDGLAGVRLIDRVADISTVLRHYRHVALLGLGGALLAIAAVLMLRYAPRQALQQLIAPLGGCLLTLALHGWFGVPANLFTVLALLLVLGLGVDYGVFLREGGALRPIPMLAISVAALTTLLAFGMLSVSATPFIRSLGLAVLTGVASTWLLAILASAPRAGAAA
ncbi:MMPL family transporter [Fontimonas sp. SYSU GA230001]|uniref:MMPL family transporter n=1 Tax=Fontimonas sp. SYSU GA230001 TaxID=3142450 RepID=UPI0032B3327A